MQIPEQMPPISKRLSLRRSVMTLLSLLLAAVMMFSCTQCKLNVDKKADENEQTAETVAEEAAQTADTKPKTDPLSFTKPDIKDDGTDGYNAAGDEGVYIYHNMALELCYANDPAAEDYAAAISAFKKNAPEMTVYNLVVPTHIEFCLPDRLKKSLYVADQAQNIEHIGKSYSEDVQLINAYNALCEHKDEYIYFNTDHHWTGLGAYYAYRAFCEQTGQTPLELSACTEKTIEGFEGTFFNSDPALAQNIDTVHYWQFPYQTHAMRKPNAGDEPYETSVYDETMGSGSAAYYTFIGGDSAEFIAYNDTNKNGRKIAVLKDSFGCAFVPYLTANYEEVHVLDPRPDYFSGSLKSYMQDHGITEVLFFNNIMSANNPFQTEYIKGIIN